MFGWAGPLAAQTDLSRFSLSKAIPADVFIAVATRHNPEREFLDAYWRRVHQAFMDSGILADCWEMISDSMEDEQLEQVEQLKSEFADLCRAVDWGEMFSREMVHAGRYVKPVAGMPYEGIFLGRLDSRDAEKNYKALKALLEQLSRFIETKAGKVVTTVTESRRSDWKAAVLSLVQAPNMGLAVACHDDVLAVAFGGLSILDDCIGLLSGEGRAKPLISTGRFKKAMGLLPPAEDEFVFFDVSNMLEQIRGMMTMAARRGEAHRARRPPRGGARDSEDDDDKPAGQKPRRQQDQDDEAGEEGGDDQDADGGDDEADEEYGGGRRIIETAGRIIDEVAIFDCIASVTWTDGYRVFDETVTLLSSGAKSKLLYPALTGARPIRQFERFIPKEATSFSCDAGLDWTALYKAVRGFIRDAVPEGKALLERFDKLQENEWEISLEKDVLGLLGGGIIHVSMGDDWVLMLAVTDEQRAAAQIKRVFQAIQKKTGKDGGLMLTPVEIMGHKFTSISHPMMMMMGGLSAPVCGCAEGHFILGSSSKAVKRCLSTAGGEHPNITRSKRWTAQGLRPEGHSIDSVSFTDESKTGEDLQAMIGGLSMASGMIGMMAGGDMPPEAGKLLARLPAILAKLGPVAGKLNFYDSSAAYTSFEGGYWHTRSVQNYKAPKDVLLEDDMDQPQTASEEDRTDSPKPARAGAKPRPDKAGESEEHEDDEDDEDDD